MAAEYSEKGAVKIVFLDKACNVLITLKRKQTPPFSSLSSLAAPAFCPSFPLCPNLKDLVILFSIVAPTIYNIL